METDEANTSLKHNNQNDSNNKDHDEDNNIALENAMQNKQRQLSYLEHHVPTHRQSIEEYIGSSPTHAKQRLSLIRKRQLLRDDSIDDDIQTAQKKSIDDDNEDIIIKERAPLGCCWASQKNNGGAVLD